MYFGKSAQLRYQFLYLFFSGFGQFVIPAVCPYVYLNRSAIFDHLDEFIQIEIHYRLYRYMKGMPDVFLIPYPFFGRKTVFHDFRIMPVGFQSNAHGRIIR